MSCSSMAFGIPLGLFRVLLLWIRPLVGKLVIIILKFPQCRTLIDFSCDNKFA